MLTEGGWMRSLCMDLGEACWEQDISLRLDGNVVVTVGPCQDGGIQDWVVVDYQGDADGVKHHEVSSYAAARKAYNLLGIGARQAIHPVLGRWRYAQLFPLGSSLEWTPIPLHSAASPRMPWGNTDGVRTCHQQRPTTSPALMFEIEPETLRHTSW